MRNSKTRTKTMKCKLNKCKHIFYAYNDIQYLYGKHLDTLEDIKEIIANIKLEGFEIGETFTSDFYCTKSNGDIMVRECLYRDKLTKPLTCKLLDESRNYWLERGVKDWGIVLNDK